MADPLVLVEGLCDALARSCDERALLGEPRLPGTVLRWPAVYGPVDYLHRLWEYLRRMDAGRPAISREAGRAGWRWTRGYRDNVAHAALVPQAIATTLGIREEAGRPLLGTVQASLRPRRLLLVLDNCEHLIEACARLACALICLRVLRRAEAVGNYVDELSCSAHTP